MMHKLLMAATALGVASMLAACGGGGSDGGSTATTPPPTTTPPTSIAGLVTQVPAPTYAAGSGELAAYQRLNAQRNQCNFGLVAQSAAIDKAAAAHLQYERTNNAYGHYETAGMMGFTGTDPSARMTAAGYSWSMAGENVTMGQPNPIDAMQVMLDLPYHSVEALSGVRDVGMSWSSAGGYFVIDYGNPLSQQLQSAPGVRTYPCEGSVDVMPLLAGEIPSPFPSEAGATWGPTISVIGTQVAVTKASVTGPAGTVAIKVIYGDGATLDPNGWCKGAKACVIPVPLAKATSYTVHLEGKDAGVPFTKDFTFKTAA